MICSISNPDAKIATNISSKNTTENTRVISATGPELVQKGNFFSPIEKLSFAVRMVKVGHTCIQMSFRFSLTSQRKLTLLHSLQTYVVDFNFQIGTQRNQGLK